MSRSLIASLLVVLLPSTTLAVPTIIAGIHYIQPNTPGQVFPILVQGPGEMVAGLDLYLLVNEGLAPAPVITAVDIVGPGTIFNTNNVGQFDLGPPYEAPGLQPTAITTTTSGFVAANGILAFITVDTTGIFGGFGFPLVYPLSLTNPDLGPTDFAINPGFDAILVDGELRFIPEPSTLALAALSLVGLIAVARRHRRRVR